MKLVIVFFDLEGWWETPFRRHFNLKRNVQNILKILNKYKINATFNTCGIVVENFPKIIEKLHNNEHEISSHGYAHENFIQLEQMGKLNEVLMRTENLIKNVTGRKPIGVRSPWCRFNKRVYSVIERRGYKWVSNQRIFRSEALDKPFRNYSLLKSAEEILMKTFTSISWKLYKKNPYKINNLLEIPLVSSMDGDLLDLIDPAQKSPKIWLDFAYRILKNQFDKSGEIFNLNFHPWLIGSCNRPILLKKILNYIFVHKKSISILPRDLIFTERE